MSKRTDCPFILHTQAGKEIAESFMKQMNMNVNSEEDRMSFYATFSAWQNNNEDKDFPDSVKKLKAFDCRVPNNKEDSNVYEESDIRPSANLRDNRLQALYNSTQVKSINKSLDKLNEEKWNGIWKILESSKEFSTIVNLLKSLKNSNSIFKSLSGVKIQLDDVTPDNPVLQEAYGQKRAYYDASNGTIHINKNGSFVNNDASSVILHEIMHAITLDLIESNPTQAKELQKILDEYKQNQGSRSYDDEHALQEFVADIFSNRTLIQELKSIQATKKLKLWDKVKQFFNNLFSGPLFSGIKEDSLMANASEELVKLLEMPVTERALGYYFEGENNNQLSLFDYVTSLDAVQKADETFGEALMKDMAKSRKTREMLKELASSQINSFAKIIAQYYSSTVSDNIAALKQTPYGQIFTGDMMLDRQILVTRFGENYTPKALLENIKKQLIEKYGTKEAIKESLMNNEDFAKLSPEEFTEKVNTIFDNAQQLIKHFDSIVPYSAIFIKATEPVSILNEQNEIVNTYEDDLLSEDFATREHWQIEHLEQSAWSTLDPAVKNIINQIEDIDEQRKPVLNELSEVSLKDARTVHATILSIVSSCTNCEQMVPELFNSITKYPWLQQICDILCGRNTDNITMYDENDKEQTKILAQNIQALFWKNFHKPFITLATIDINNDNARLNILNELQYSEDLYEDTATNIFENKPFDGAIYKVGGTLNRRNYLALLKEIQNDTKLQEFFSASDIREVGKYREQYAKVYNILQKLGINIPKQTLVIFFRGSKSNITTFKNILFNNIFNENVENNAAYQGLLKNQNQAVFSAFNSSYKQLAKLLSFGKEVTHENSVTVTLDNKSKTLYSNTYPSLILDLMANLKQPKDQVRQFIEQEYLYDFHFNKKVGNRLVIPNVWLRELYEGDMKHSDMVSLINILGSNGKTYLAENESESQITNLLAYFAKRSPIVGGYSYTYYPVGTFADAKSAYYIRNRIRTLDECLDGMVDMILMEMDHIKYVQAKKKAIERTKGNLKDKRTAIEFFDERETLPLLPEVDIERFIEEIKNYKTNNSKRSYIKSIIQSVLEVRFDSFKEDLNKNRIIEQSPALNKILSSKQDDMLKEYFYNTTLANACMDNMFIVDYNMFKNSDMKQKRFKMMYSPYSTAYTHCYLYENDKPVDQNLGFRKDDKGRFVEFSVLLSDRITESPSFSQVKETFDNLLKEGVINQQQYNLITEGIKEINVGDGQCYRNPKSYERLINMLGQGQNKSVRKALEIIRQSYNSPNVILSQGYWEAVFNVLKPLVAGYEEVDTGITAEDLGIANEKEVERYAKVKVPVMHKNSEFLLMAIYPVIQGIVTQSPKLRAINKFMEDYDIDKVQFESASKVGNHGVIDINDEKKVYIEDNVIYDEKDNRITPSEDDVYYDINSDKYYAWSEEDGLYEMDYEDWVYETLVRNCGLYDFQKDEPESPRQIQFNDGYNNNFIHATPLERYGIISNVPEHLLEHTKSNLGTQFIKISEEDAVTHDKNGNPISLDVRINNSKVSFTVEQVHELFQDVLVDYVQKAFVELDSTFNNPIKLKEFILQEMSKQTVYNENLEDCLRIDPATKRFDISLLNPIRANAFIAFCASLIRKEMIQHKIKQGLLPQVSAFGLENNLQLRYFTKEFTDKNGITKRTLVFTSKEWIGVDKVDSNYENDLAILKSKFKSYREYKNSEFGKGHSIAYMEVATPLYDNLFKKFVDSKTGLFNTEAFEKAISPDIRYAIGYRIPTEAKHSMVPLRVKHFLPYQNASCVMMAIDWVFLSGSDFDIDKLFTILPELEEINNVKTAIDNIIEELNITNNTDKRIVNQVVKHIAFGTSIPNNILISDLGKKVAELANKIDLYKIQPVQFKSNDYSFDSVKQAIKQNNRAANNNLFLSLAASLLQSESNLKHILTPNSIEHVKATSSIIKILSNPNNKFSGEKLRTLLGTRDDKTLVKNYNIEATNLAPNDPRLRNIEHYKNMTGLNLTALFAVFRAFLPVVQKTTMTTRDSFILNGNISVKDNYGSLTNRRNAITKDYISDLIGEYIAAAVDNAKDPRLAYLRFNLVTAPYAVFLTLRGYTTTEIALLFNQPIIIDVINTYITSNKTYSLSRICEDVYNSIDEKLENKNVDVNDIAYTSLSDIKLAQCINLDARGVDFSEEGNEKLLAFQKMVLNEFMKLIPVVTEFNNYAGINRNSTVANAVPSDTAYLIKKLDDYEFLKRKQDSNKKQLNGTERLVASFTENPADKFEAILRDLGLLHIDDLLSNVDFKTTSLFKKVNKRYLDLLGSINIKESDINNLSIITQNFIYSYYLTPNKYTKSMFDILRKVIKAETGLETDANDNYTGRTLLMWGLPMIVSRLKASRQLTDTGDILSYLNRYSDQNSNTTAIGVWGKNRSKDKITQMSIAWSSLYQRDENYTITIGVENISINSKDLANMLLFYNIVKGGITPSYQNFIQAFPNGQEFEIPEFKELTNDIDEDILSLDELDKVVEQYIQNFPLSASGVKVIKPKVFAELTGQEENKIDFIPDIIIVRNLSSLNKLKINSTDYCKYFSTVLNGTTVLYKSDNKGSWKRIPTLGSNGTYLETGKDVNESILTSNNVVNITNQTLDELEKKFDLIQDKTEDPYIQDAIQSEERIFSDLKDKIINTLSSALSNKNAEVATIVYNDEQEVQDTDQTGMKICSIKR